MCPAENPDLDHEARGSRRPRTFFAGMIAFGDGSRAFACVIRELSESGARVEVPASRLIPTRMFLLSSKRPVAFDTEVVWRTKNLTGLKIHRTLDLAECSDPQLQFLKPLSARLCGASRGWP
jgi:hypothetical protein